MVAYQTDHNQEDDVPYREGERRAEGVLEGGVHHLVFDFVGEMLCYPRGQEVVKVSEKEDRQ